MPYRSSLLMIEQNQQHAQTISCDGGVPGKTICIRSGCQVHPVMCDSDECTCHIAHKTHQYSELSEVMNAIEDAARIEHEIEGQQMLMEQHLQEAEEKIRHCKESHQRMLTQKASKQGNIAKLRHKLVSGDANELLTGEIIGGILSELKQSKHSEQKALYISTREEMTSQLTKWMSCFQSFMENTQRLRNLEVGQSNAKTQLNEKAISACDIDQINRKTAHLTIQKCISEQWQQIGASIIKLSNLVQLRVGRCQSSGAVVTSLTAPQLTVLTICSCGLSDKGVESIVQNLPNLISLDLRFNDIGVASAHAMKDLKKLLKLCIMRNENFGDQGMLVLASGLPQLQQLNADTCGLTDKGAQALAKGFKNLRQMDIESNSQITDKGLIAIAQNLAQLTSLNLKSINLITDKGIQLVGRYLRNLTYLDMQSASSVTDEGATAISQLENLTFLNIQNTSIGKQGVTLIANRLNKLKQLYVYTPIGQDGAEAIARGLPHLTYLQIGYCDINDQGAIMMACHLTNLNTLMIYGNSIRNKGAIAIANNLGKLTQLWISNNYIEDEGALQLTRKLRNLEVFSIKNNSITKDCGHQIKRFMPRTKWFD